MNSIIFVLVLASGDGGINTDLKFRDEADCKAAASAINNRLDDRSPEGFRTGFRYMGAKCIKTNRVILN
jgi:hypothetical protein